MTFQKNEQADIDDKRDHSGHAVSNELRDHGSLEDAQDLHGRTLRVCVVMPVHNESANVRAVAAECLASLRAAGHVPTLLLVDDGSRDDTLAILRELAAGDEGLSFASFSRNFGKEAAIMAGLDEAGDGHDLIAYMDGDGQHDPADLVAMIEQARDGDVDLVCGARVARGYQPPIQRWLTKRFYGLFRALTGENIEEGVGDFNVLKPKVVRVLRRLDEDQPFMKGLIAWVGFRRRIVPITVRERAGGEAKSSIRSLSRLAFGAFLSFSSWPLRTWSVVGVCSALVALLYLAVVVAEAVLFGRDVPGYATTVVLILGLGGLQLFSVGIVGEYIARIHDASKNRPRFIVAERSTASRQAARSNDFEERLRTELGASSPHVSSAGARSAADITPAAAVAAPSVL